MRNTNRTAWQRREESGEVVRPDTLVISAGKYGSCNQYTRWLIDRLGADGMAYDKRQLGYASRYKNIIWVGAIKDGTIKGTNIFWQNYRNFGLEGKTIVMCGVGLGDPENKDYFDKVMRRSGSDQGYCTCLILPGRIDQSSLNMLDKPQFEKFLVDAKRIYGEETAALINERAANNYNGVDAMALEPVVQTILATRNQ